MSRFRRLLLQVFFAFAFAFLLGAQTEESAEPVSPDSTEPDKGLVDVYVVPITEAISSPNKFILRRALKDAIENDVGMVILEMDTPGGRVDITLDMMEMLDRFEGITATYINDDAISAGSFIAASTQEIYFAPRGKIGASAVIQGTGEDVPETARQKVESYLLANVRVMTEDDPYRADVIRAMLDADFEFKIGDEVIKPAGELLTLTAKEAMEEYGDPPRPLLGAGIHETIEELLDARFGEGAYRIRSFELTYSEELAKWMAAIAPGLLGIGMLLLFIEFKTPGFGIFGIAGLILIGVFFLSNYIAGLAGNEAIIAFVIGLLLVLLELLLFPGTIVFALSGLVLIVASFIWAMMDIWPGEGFEFSAELLAQPLFNASIAGLIAVVGAMIVARLLPGSFLERSIVLSTAVGGGGTTTVNPPEPSGPPAGSFGTAVSALRPGGRVEVGGQRYEARANVGTIDRGAAIRVLRAEDFGLVVEEVES